MHKSPKVEIQNAKKNLISSPPASEMLVSKAAFARYWAGESRIILLIGQASHNIV